MSEVSLFQAYWRKHNFTVRCVVKWRLKSEKFFIYWEEVPLLTPQTEHSLTPEGEWGKSQVFDP